MVDSVDLRITHFPVSIHQYKLNPKIYERSADGGGGILLRLLSVETVKRW